MTPDERELRRALESRSGEMSPQFRSRLSGTLGEGRPVANALPAIALIVVIVLSVTSVSVLLMARGAGRVSYGSATGARYTVTTSLMSAKGGPLNACFFMPLPLPPIGCGGVEVTNVDVAAIPGTITYKNGTVGTPVVRLVGTWDGRVLRLTENPQPAPGTNTIPQRVTQAPPAASGKTNQQVLEEIRRDADALRKRGIILLAWGEGADGAEVTLVVADPPSVQYLYDTYGRLQIKGWLQPVKPPSPSPTPIAMPTTVEISAPSGDVVWAYVGAVALYRSTDRGQTWEARTLPVSQPGVWPEISFVDGQEGWYSMSGSPETQCNAQETGIWHTGDGGATWQALRSSGISASQCKQGLSFADATQGFLAAGDESRKPSIYRTSDGGRTWRGSTLPDPPGFVTQAGGFTLHAGSVRGFGSTLLVPAWGMNAASNQLEGYVFNSTDGGASWNVVAKIPAPTTSIAIVTAERWLQLVEPHQSSETTDAGKTWHAYPTDYSQAAPVAPQTTFGDSAVGYATVRGSIQRTVDGGAHWVMIKTPGT
jgi:photosystem II stability/assembly factor-like uncharacterized protein